MPKIKLPFTEETIPSELKAYAGADHSVEVFVGKSQDDVAAELNPGLATNRDTLRKEKETIQEKYNNLLKTSSDTSTELMELRSQIASGGQVSAEDLALLTEVKKAAPNAKKEDVKNMLATYPQVVGELTTLKTQTENEKLFALSGYKNQKVFTDLLGDKAKNPNLEKVEVETETVDGKPVEKLVAHVKENNVVTKVPFTEYVTKNQEWNHYMPALTNGTEAKTWLPQPPAGGGSDDKSGKGPLDAFIESENKKNSEKPNPLLGNTATKTAASGSQVNQN